MSRCRKADLEGNFCQGSHPGAKGKEKCLWEAFQREKTEGNGKNQMMSLSIRIMGEKLYYVKAEGYKTSGSFSVTYYQYCIQTKKRKKISESKYRAAVGKLYA